MAEVSGVGWTLATAQLRFLRYCPNMQLGVLICLCLVTCAVATLLLIPSLLRLREQTVPSAVAPGESSIARSTRRYRARYCTQRAGTLLGIANSMFAGIALGT